MKENKKSSFLITKEVIAIVLLTVVLVGAYSYFSNRAVSQPSSDSVQPEQSEWQSLPVEEESNEPRSPFKQKALVKTTQNGNTTETTTISKREVELTEEDEQKYYGNHPEYKGWNAAYSAQELYRYPEEWGYHSFWDMLLSDDSGETSRTVVSLSITSYKAKRENYDDRKILDAEIGYLVPSLNERLVKVAEFETIDSRKIAKLKEVNEGNIVTIKYFIERPQDPERVTVIYANPMIPDVTEANEPTLDDVVRSFMYIPYEYK